MVLESKPPKLSIVVWSDLSDEQIRKLEELTDPESFNSFFIKIFHWEPNTKHTTILCDLFYYAFNFARMNKFNHEQISTFLSIIKRVHAMCICTPFSNMEETYQYFKVLVLKHSLSRPPFYLRIFTPDVTKKVTDYVIDTYFRHYKMYKYVFTSTIDFNLKFTYEGMIVENQEEEKERPKTAHTDQQPTAEEQQRQSQLVEVRKLVQTFVKEEIRKIQSTTVELPPPAPRTPADKRRSGKSGSTKSSKPQTPK